MPTGKPRIILIDRDPTTISYPILAEFIGVTFGLSTTPSLGGYSGAFAFPAEILRVQDATIEGQVAPSQNRVCECIDCTFSADTDLDKLVDVLRLVRPRFQGKIAAATGINYLRIEGGSVKGEMQVGPRRLILTDGFTCGANDAEPSVGPYGLFTPIEYIYLDNVRFAGGPSMVSNTHVQYLGTERPFTIGSVSGTTMNFPFTGFDDYTNAAWMIVRSFDIGASLAKNDKLKSGVITSIRLDRVNALWKVAGTWAAPVAGETWTYRIAREITTKRVRVLDGRMLLSADMTAILAADSIN